MREKSGGPARHVQTRRQAEVSGGAVDRKNKKNPFEVIVAADTDFIYDTFWSSGRTILENNYFIPLYDNANFILNSLDYLAGDETLIDLRGRTQKIRRFEGIENMRKENLRNFRIKENDIFRQIDKTKKALQEVFGKESLKNETTSLPTNWQ